MLFSFVRVPLKMKRPTDDGEFQYSLKIHILTDVSVAHIPAVNMRPIEIAQQIIYILDCKCC